jgi:septal ring factor EnvC (AmiA/AmiB activator)
MSEQQIINIYGNPILARLEQEIERLNNICKYAHNEIKDQRAAIKALEAELATSERSSSRTKVNEHAKNLRRTRADMLGTEDNDHYFECQRAAAYIEQLEALLKVAKCPDPNCEDGVVQVFTGEVYQCQWCDERAALEDSDE